MACFNFKVSCNCSQHMCMFGLNLCACFLHWMRMCAQWYLFVGIACWSAVCCSHGADHMCRWTYSLPRLIRTKVSKLHCGVTCYAVHSLLVAWHVLFVAVFHDRVMMCSLRVCTLWCLTMNVCPFHFSHCCFLISTDSRLFPLLFCLRVLLTVPAFCLQIWLASSVFSCVAILCCAIFFFFFLW